jgi:dTDP-glucose 4,6-dehydratase
MNLLLTGGTGFFGKALLRHWKDLAAQGRAVPNVTVLSRQPEAFLARHPAFAAQPWLRFHQGDVLRPSSLPAAPAFTHVLHAAADSTDAPKLKPLQRYAQIVDGTRHLLDYSAAHGIGRFLFTSSGGVYGPQPKDMDRIPETYQGMPDPLDERNSYGVAKRCAEHLCKLYSEQYGLEVVIARCFAFVGRDLPLDAHFAIGNFIRDALHSSEIVVRGDGSPVRTYLDQRDLAKWLETLLIHGKSGSAYNVGGDQTITILELARIIRDLLAPDKTINIIGSIESKSLNNRYVPDISRARVEFGLTSTILLPDSISETKKHFSTS